MEKIWYKAKVILGKKIAQTLGFPTINLDNPALLSGKKKGVYACNVKIAGISYSGVLYFGPRLVLFESNNILEIFILDFNKRVYGKTVEFQLLNFIRPPQNFSSLEKLKKQLKRDISACQKFPTLTKTSN